jgi:hypothetical protein
MILPAEYVVYFSGNGPKEGEFDGEPGWFQLWAPDEVEQLNQDYQVQEFAPGFLGFGSSGGGEMFAFDSGGGVVIMPFIGMSLSQAEIVATSWRDFVAKIKK